MTSTRLGEKMSFLSAVYAHSPVAISFWDAKGHLLGWNEACTVVFGSRIGRSEAGSMFLFGDPRVPGEVKASLRRGQIARYEYAMPTDTELRQRLGSDANGAGLTHLDVMVIPVYDGMDHTLCGYVQQIIDISVRKQAEARLQESEELFRTVFSESPIGIQLCTPDHQVIATNRACLNMFGLTPQQEWCVLSVFEQAERKSELVRRTVEGDPVQYEGFFDFGIAGQAGFPGMGRSGVIYLSMQVTPLPQHASVSLQSRCLVQVRDATDRNRAERAMRNFSRRLVEAQESERRLIARELHDEIGQSLTGIQIMLGMVKSGAGSANLVEDALALISTIMFQVSDLSLSLRPPMLDDHGLLPTLQWHIGRYVEQTGVDIDFKHDGIERRFATAIETGIYRIAQEALTNIARHARVQDAAVRVVGTASSILLEVEDRGKGFEAEAGVCGGRSSGLFGIRERVKVLRGQLHIDSRPGQGTRLIVQIPLDGCLV